MRRYTDPAAKYFALTPSMAYLASDTLAVMADSDRQAQYRAHAHVLAAIGDHLASAEIAPVEVRIPRDLADSAVAAWDWDDEGNPDPEDIDQRTQRHHAGTLALIGLSIKEGGRYVGEEVVVDLAPSLIGEAFIAWDNVPPQ